MAEYSIDTDFSSQKQDNCASNSAVAIHDPPIAVAEAWRKRGYPSLAIEWALEARARRMRLNGPPGAPREPPPPPRPRREYLPKRIRWHIPYAAGPQAYALAHAWLDGWTVWALGGASPGSPAEIIKARTAREFGLTVREMLSPQRIKPIVLARHAAIYLTYKITRESTVKIGRRYGDRDHTTIMNSIRTAAARLADDPEFAARIDRLTTELELEIFLYEAGREDAHAKQAPALAGTDRLRDRHLHGEMCAPPEVTSIPPRRNGLSG